MNQILKKYEDVKVLENAEQAKAMAKGVAESNQFALEQMFAMSDKGGDIIVCATKDQDAILEFVVGSTAPDSAITLFAPHPVFATPGTLLKAREEVIDAIRKHRPDAQMLNDHIRNRAALLSELGFAHLIDVLKILESPTTAA